MPVRPSAPSTLWPAATPAYAVPQNAAWNGAGGAGSSPASSSAPRTAVDAHLGDGPVLEAAERVDADAGDLDARPVIAGANA